MGILSYITGAKQKFKNKSTDEEVTNARRGLVQRDIEVYDEKKPSIRAMISGAKQKFRQTKTRLEIMQKEHKERQNIKLESKLEHLTLKRKVMTEQKKLAKLKSQKPRGLRALMGGVNIPTAQQPRGERGMSMGGNPFPGSTTQETPKKKNIVQEERNALGGKDPFG